MISVYTGTPGSGKSYHATERIDILLKRGVNVICNYMIKTNYRHKGDFIYIKTSELTVDFLVGYAMSKHERRKEGQTVVIIDEAHIMFNSRGYDMHERLKWLQFLSCSRHLGFDILMITQNDKSIDQQVRGLIEYNYKHRLITRFGIKSWLLVILFRAKFVSVKCWYVIDEKCDVYFFRIKKKTANLYDTFAMFEDYDVNKKIENLKGNDKKKEIEEFNRRFEKGEENETI